MGSIRVAVVGGGIGGLAAAVALRFVGCAGGGRRGRRHRRHPFRAANHVVEPGPPVFSGRVAYRGVLPAARVPDWPRDESVLWNGDGKHVLTFPVRAGELRDYVGFVPADEHMRESWSAPGDPAVLAAEFSGWDPQLTELLSQVETTFRWGLYDRDPIRNRR